MSGRRDDFGVVRFRFGESSFHTNHQHSMTFLAIYLSMMVGAICTLIALTAMRRREKHNIGKLGWMCLVLLTPPFGLLLFVLFGGRRISAEHDEREQLELPGGPAGENVDGPLAEIALSRGLPPPSNCNRFDWSTSPETMKRSLIELVESAKNRIFVHCFILSDDDTGNELIRVLARKANAGVEVKLMVDGFGSFLFPDRLLQQIIDAGGQTTRFKPLSRLSRFAYSNFRNHRKLVCVDGHRALIGGANFVQYEMTDQPDQETWIDYVARIDGVSARHLEAVFVSDWNFATDDDLELTPQREAMAQCELCKGGTAVQVIPIGPDGPDEVLDDIWLTTIHRAKARIWIITPYFVPPPIAMGALMTAARRGLDVRVMFPSESDVLPADYARHDYAEDLSTVGAKVLRYPDRMVHAKMLIVDDDVAFVGSANFDMRSFFLNYELTVGVLCKRKVAEMSAWFEMLSANCVQDPKPATWKRRSLRVLTRIFAQEL